MSTRRPRPEHDVGPAEAPPPKNPRRLRSRLRRYRWLLMACAALFVGFAIVVGVTVGGPEVGEAALGPEAAETGTVNLGTGLAGVGVNDDPNEAEESPPEPVDEGRYIADGEASYYGRELAGRPTASGETFMPARLTAAHRTLPFGTKVRVTNLNNDRSVVVRINDRGPYAKRRVIDLSEAAARRVGMVSIGHARVRLQVIE